MRYVALASMSYGTGIFAVYGGRLGWTNSGGEAISDSFARRIIEFVSGKGGDDIIRVCHVPIKGVDGAVPTIDTLDLVDTDRETVDFLSEDNNLSSFDCIIVSGYSSASPLVRSNLQSFVSSGGGLIIEDFRSSGAVDIFQSISSVTVSDIGFSVTGGNVVWTDSGRGLSLFSESYLSETVPMINTIDEDGMGSLWTIISVYDTDSEKESGLTEGVELISSDDIDIIGESFMAVYRSTYVNGTIDIEKDTS